MQCIWSTAVRAAPWNYVRWRTTALAREKTRYFRCVISYYAASITHRDPNSTIPRKTGIMSNVRRANFTTTAIQKDISSQEDRLEETSHPPPESSTVPFHEEDGSASPMTAAQLSRAAASAVRRCTPTDALYIVNSLHFSTYGHLREEALRVLDETRRSTRLPLQKHVEFKPIDFGQAVSPRLSAHCFLHSLIRRGHSYQASNFAQLMVENGLRVNTFTMESVIKAVCEADHGGLLARHQAWTHPSGPFPSLQSSQELFYNIGHEAAFKILQLAREHGQRRTQAMYDTLISACLLQGEIIVAALLFACLVKDWQVRKAAKKLAHASPDPEGHSADVPQGEAARRTELNLRLQWIKKNLPAESILYTPFPDVILLKKITHRIELSFARNLPPDKQDGELQEAMQALAILTHLVENGHMHFGKLSPIIRALYNSPRCDVRVWRVTKKPISVHAYHYFHEFLMRLISSLHEPLTMATPPLDCRTCNSLLHYSLRHRMSPKQAADIMEYMLNERGFRPDTATMTVLLRSGTVLRRDDLVKFATKNIRRLEGHEDEDEDIESTRRLEGHEDEDEGIESTRRLEGHEDEDVDIESTRRLEGHEDEDVDIESTRRLEDHEDIDVDRDRDPLAPRDPEEFAPKIPRRGIPRTRFSKALARLHREDFQAEFKTLNSSSPRQADEGIVVSYITHLASTGRAAVIVEVLFDILPELATVRHSASVQTDGEEHEEPVFSGTREEAVQRAVLLGPRFFTALLNALAKAHKTGLAERVWILAKRAEKSSWAEGFVPGAEPWYLPIAAYTSMMQCYAYEARIGLPIRSVDQDGSVTYIPRGDTSASDWGALQRHRRTTPTAVRNGYDGAKAMARVILRDLVAGGSSVPQEPLNHGQSLPSGHANGLLTRPVPDARFWNATLLLFRPTPWMHPRRASGISPSRTVRFLRWCEERFYRDGSKSIHWDPFLQEIAEAMLNFGYPIPPGFRHLFVGHYTAATQDFPPPQAPDCTPYAFPGARSRYRPHGLPTYKGRGLPIRAEIGRAHV